MIMHASNQNNMNRFRQTVAEITKDMFFLRFDLFLLISPFYARIAVFAYIVFYNVYFIF